MRREVQTLEETWDRNVFTSYEEIKRELKRIRTLECRCNERLKTQGYGSTLPREPFSIHKGSCVSLIFNLLLSEKTRVKEKTYI